jgi:hypothetical protein
MTRALSLLCLFLPAVAFGKAPPSPAADDVAHVVADCGAALRSSGSAGYGIRIVSGGYVAGMQAYIHTLAATNSPGGFTAMVNVEQRSTPKNGAIVMILGNTSGEKNAFELQINAQTVTDGCHVAMLNKLELNGNTSSTMELRCRLP